jgi:hypothetical protein
MLAVSVVSDPQPLAPYVQVLRQWQRGETSSMHGLHNVPAREALLCTHCIGQF